MPFFVARMSASGRVVTVDQAQYETSEAAEAKAQPRYPHDYTWVVEAANSPRAALLASEMADAWKLGTGIAERVIAPEEASD